MPALLAPPRRQLARCICPGAYVQHLALPPRPPSPRLQVHREFASQSRPYSASNSSPSSASGSALTHTSARPPPPPPPPPRWLADLRARIGKCLMFGCNSTQIAQGAAVLRALATGWRALLAGSEGFLTGGRRGLDGREIAWGEMDSFGHVNNVNYYRYAESARVNWITNFAVHVDPAHRVKWADLMSPKSTGLIMRSLKADFKFPMVYPDKISVYHKLRSKPEGEPALGSFFLDCIVLSHQHKRVSARLEEDIVVYDYMEGRKTSMPPFMVHLFDRTWKLQQEETVRARTRIWGLIEAVEKLEKETWDRPDAVEDMGSVKSKP